MYLFFSSLLKDSFIKGHVRFLFYVKIYSLKPVCCSLATISFPFMGFSYLFEAGTPAKWNNPQNYAIHLCWFVVWDIQHYFIGCVTLYIMLFKSFQTSAIHCAQFVPLKQKLFSFRRHKYSSGAVTSLSTPFRLKSHKTSIVHLCR